jgi:hypothetical protein
MVNRRDRKMEENQKLECGRCANVTGMNIEILNWLGPPWEGDWGGVKRTGRDEPIGIVIHICIETIQGDSVAIFM